MSASGKHTSKPYSDLTIALAGNPNCGKTTLFNALTGTKQQVGNWPGVTVEQKSGYFTAGSTTIRIIDLPGVYSLTQASTGAVDEHIACTAILQRDTQILVNVVDASHLERHLYLTLQLIELGAPVVLALNMIDIAHARGIAIDESRLAAFLQCPVVTLEARRGQGIMKLRETVTHYTASESSATRKWIFPAPIEQALQTITAQLLASGECDDATQARAMASLLLEGDAETTAHVSSIVSNSVLAQKAAISTLLGEDADILMADTRYRFIQDILTTCIKQSPVSTVSWTSRIDAFVLHRIWGVPVFLSIMYLLFFFAVNVGGAFQDFFDIASQTIFVEGFAQLLTHWQVPAWLTALLANGLGKGVNTTLTFIPVIGALFLFLAFLEDSGYMVRAAFLVDRCMRFLGLPGKAFVPMIVGFGCNVPAVMAARTLENKRDRILTIMMSPFMSCGARLAIYAVFTAAFFPQGGQNVVFALYMIGIAMAMFTGFILRRSVLKGTVSPLIMELPPYHLPKLSALLLHAWQRLRGFVLRAGKLIVPICVLIGALNALNVDGTLNTGEGSAQSILSAMGRMVTPLFAPMGIHADNWPATVGLVTGVLAKEVVIGTLNTLYMQTGHLSVMPHEVFSLGKGLLAAWHSILFNFSQLGTALSNPILAAKAPVYPLEQGVYGVMARQFDGKVGAFAYLLFVLLYFPCVSTLAVMLRELHRGWALFSAAWMTGIAYGAAVFFYQAATWNKHPFSSLCWMVGILAVLASMIFLMRFLARDKSIPVNLSLAPAGENS